MSKTIERLVKRNPKKIKSWWYEGKENGYWLELNKEFHCEGFSCVHEWTVKDLLEAFKRVRRKTKEEGEL